MTKPHSRGYSKKSDLTRKLKACAKRNTLLLVIVSATILGICLGIALRQIQPPFTKRQVFYLRFPGDIFLQMLHMLLLPLVVSSIVYGTSSLHLRSSGKMGIIATIYYLSTTTIAAVIGLSLGVAIRPGDLGHIKPPGENATRVFNTADVLLDIVRNLFPDNLIQACFKKIVTFQVPRAVAKDDNITDSVFRRNVSEKEQVEYDPVVGLGSGTNVLGLIMFSALLGIVISMLGDEGKPLKDFFISLHKASMTLTIMVIWCSPIGVMFLIAAKIVEIVEPEVIFRLVGMYVVTAITGFILHGLIVLPLIYAIIVRRNPFIFLHGMLEAFVTMIAVASSAATLPVTMRCLMENNRVDRRVVMFIAPVGATINMDGACLCMVIMTLFVAQMNNISLDAGQILTVSLTAIAASVGAAAIPSGALVVIAMVLTSVGLPVDITLIAAVDWLLDRFRGVVNILGDSIGAGVIEHLSKQELSETNDDVDLDKDDEEDSML